MGRNDPTQEPQQGEGSFVLSTTSHLAEGHNPDYIDRHRLLVYIVQCHSAWIADAQKRDSNLVKGIAIGNAMALENIHSWIKADK